MEIYDCLFEDAGEHFVDVSMDGRSRLAFAASSNAHLSALAAAVRTCRQIYSEANPILYVITTAVLTIGPFTSSEVLPPFKQLPNDKLLRQAKCMELVVEAYVPGDNRYATDNIRRLIDDLGPDPGVSIVDVEVTVWARVGKGNGDKIVQALVGLDCARGATMRRGRVNGAITESAWRELMETLEGVDA